MRIRLLTLTVALISVAGCTSEQALSFPPALPSIVAKSIEFHGGSLYENSAMVLTISSLSGSFQLEVTRQGGQFDHAVIGTI